MDLKMSTVCTQEEKHGFRLISMLNEQGRFALQLCMFFLLPGLTSKTFGEYLGQPHIKKKIDDAYKRTVIADEQYYILYPRSGSPDIETLDITLMVFLLRELHPFLKHSNQIWTQSPVSNSIEADIVRVRDTRNRLLHSVKLTEVEFEREYIHIETVLCRLIESAGGTKIKAEEIRIKLKNKKHDPFESKPGQADISTSVSDSLERMNKTVKHEKDKTTSTSSLQKVQNDKMRENNTERKVCCFGNLLLFQSCFKDLEPITVQTNDHSLLDYRCCIRSIAVLEDDTVLLTDTIHDTVQAFTSSGEPFQEFKCNKPNDVCAINYNTVAVSLNKERKLVILNVDFQSLIISCKIDYNVRCTCDITGVRYNSGFLYVLCEKGEVHALNINTGAEQALYKTNVQSPSYFDINPDGTRLYISKGNTVNCICLPGNIIHTFTDKNGRELMGITLGKEKVYASVWDSGVILKLKKDLTLIKEISSDIPQNPMALCRHKCYLYISNYRTDLDRYMCREIIIVRK